MTRQPAAIFLVDILKEHIALKEARRLNIPTFAMVDTNSNPSLVDFPIPANDDATKSIALILDYITGAIKDGLQDRKLAKEKQAEEKTAPKNEDAPAKEEAPKSEEVAEEVTASKEEAAEEVKAEDKKD
jgi:small subunit ribosomal protein S2